MKILKQKKSWILGTVSIIAFLLCANIIAQKNNSPGTQDKAYKLSLVSESPIFPGCEGEDWEIRKCLSESLTDHFKNNFQSKVLRKMEGKKRVSVIFQIDKNGEFTSIRTGTENKSVVKEINRAFNLLPTAIPGKRKNEKVNVIYSLFIYLSDGDFEVKARPTIY